MAMKMKPEWNRQADCISLHEICCSCRWLVG